MTGGLVEAVRVALEIGGVLLLLGVLGQVPRLARFWPFLVVLGLLDAVRIDVIDRRWALESLIQDGPWISGLLLLAAQGLALRVVGVRQRWLAAFAAVWLPVVALVGALSDLAPDSRARRVLVGTGIAAVGVAGVGIGPVSALSGVGSVSLAGLLILLPLGLELWRGTPIQATGSGPDARAPGLALVVMHGVGAIVLTWLAMAGGVLESMAFGLEQAPVYVPRVTHLLFAVGALLIGGLVPRGMAALVLAQVLLRAMGLRGDGVATVITVGATLGGGLPALYALGALRAGWWIWLVQALVFLIWVRLSLPG